MAQHRFSTPAQRTAAAVVSHQGIELAVTFP